MSDSSDSKSANPKSTIPKSTIPKSVIPKSVDPAAQKLAEDAIGIMLSRDRAAKWLGVQLLEVHPGASKTSMVVREEMLNGLGSCHGGMLLAFADATLATACNSYDYYAVVTNCTSEFVNPAFPGDQLTAVASLRTARNRNYIYDITVTNQKGDCILIFVAKAYRIRSDKRFTESVDKNP